MFKINKVILASKPKTRYNILTGFGIKPEVIETNADENISGDFPTEHIVKELSMRKAAKAAEIINDSSSLIIAADTVVAFENKILGKPSDERDAFETLTMLSGKNHEVYSGLTLSLNGKTLCGFDITSVKFREISEYEIDLYIKTGDPMTRAGSYGAEGIGAAFIEKIDGDFFNIAGLPVYRFVEMLKNGFNINIFDLVK